MFLFADNLSRSFMHSRDQRGGLSWSSDAWEHPNSMNVELEDRQQRLEWDQWENAVIPSPATAGVAAGDCVADEDSAHKFHLLSGILRPCYGFLPSNNISASPLQLSQNQMGLQLPSSDIHSLAADNIPSSIHAISAPHGASDHLTSNFSGLGAVCSDLRYDHSTRRHLLGIMGLDHKSLISDFSSKPNDLYRAEAHGQIGLNLGVRTYFSTEDNLFSRLSKRARANSPGGSQAPMCQAQGCNSDLTIAKHYHRRHKVCELHSKAVQVITNGQNQRFCQQCSRFHPLPEFDEGKRSCRKRLADHNRRRRKPQLNSSTSCKRPESLICDVKQEDMDQTLAIADQADDKITSSEEKQENMVHWNHENSPTPSLENAEKQQLRTISKVDCRSSTDKTTTQASLSNNFSSSRKSLSDSSQALLSPISASSPLSFLLQNHNKGHLGGSAGPPEDTVYQHILQGVCGNNLGPSLSLSSSSIMSERCHYTQPEYMSLPQTYSSDVDTTVPWLKTMDLKSSCIDHCTNRQHPMRLDNATTCHELPTSQMLPPFIHNLLPFESPRGMETSDWMLGSMNCPKREHLSRLELSPSSRLDQCHQMQFTAALSNEARVQVTRTPNILNFLRQEPTINSDHSDETASTDEELSRLKFSELNVLRSFESIYDSHNSFV